MVARVARDGAAAALRPRARANASFPSDLEAALDDACSDVRG